MNTYGHVVVTSTADCDLSKIKSADLAALFAPYQPLHRAPYDLANCFDRTNLAIVIRGHIDRCESYVALARRLHGAGLMSTTDFAHRAGERLADLREHRTALFRLNELGRN